MKKVELVFDRLSVDWTPEEDEAFNEIEKQSNLGKQILKEIEQDWRKHASEYERGFIDGMQKQMQSSVDRAVNAMSKREWVGLTDKEIEAIWKIAMFIDYGIGAELSNQPFVHYARAIKAKARTSRRHTRKPKKASSKRSLAHVQVW